MSTPKSEFLKVILDRGYLHQCTDWDALDALAAKQPVTAYIGFDATADSLHVGTWCRSCCCAACSRPATGRSR